ncbi:MAG: alpha/beta fold hydrolase [Dehalococcoidia bacterium]
MRIAGAALVALVAIGAVVVLLLAFTAGSTQAPELPSHTATPPAATPTPLPRTWPSGLRIPTTGTPELISCLDTDHDGRIDATDGPQFAGLDIRLVPGEACVDPSQHADFFAGSPSDPAGYSCSAPRPPLLIVAVASAGSDILEPSMGESMGVLDIVNELQARAATAGISTLPVLSTSAVFGADKPQTRMEQWIEHDVARRLDALPCLRVALIGHSHGGVTVTSVTAALDGRYAGRMFGVMLDRTTALYDRPATEMPVKTPLLNVYQTNEGWHGVPIDQPNVMNVDASREVAPIAPSDGGGGPALVSHKTLDDAPAVQRRVVDAVMAWAGAP